jgi:ketosteroid isomerase-like protein
MPGLLHRAGREKGIIGMSDAQEVVDRLKAAYDRHDLDGITRCYDPQGVSVSPGGIAEGEDQIASYHAMFLEAFPDAMLTPWSEIVCGDTSIMEFTVTGTHTGPYLIPGGEVVEATGRPIVMRGCSVFTVENGRITAHRFYFDQLELVSQLGCALTIGGRGC